MKAARWVVVFAICACVSLAGTVVLAEEPGKETTGAADKSKDAKKDRKPSPAEQAAPAKTAPEPTAGGEEPSHVYTNDDLDRLAPPSPMPSGPAPAPKEPAAKAAPEAYDPLKQMQDQQSAAAERAAKITDAEKRVAASEARVADLEKRSLAAKNPFLARPQIPADQSAEWNKMDGSQRVQKTQDDLAQARKELDSAKADLQKLRSGG